MERIRNLNVYQKVILILLSVTLACFAVLYHMTVSRVGYSYMDTILVPMEENGNTVYSGEIDGETAAFTVSDDSVTFHYAGMVYGPYTVKLDSSAIPEDHSNAHLMTGVEILEGEAVFFRGGIIEYGSGWLVEREDGRPNVTVQTANGIVTDEYGNVIDPMEPSVGTILELLHGPELTHKGQWAMWFLGLFVALCTAASMLFADELFYLGIWHRVRNPELAEPSDWVITGRYIGWTVSLIGEVILLWMGLQI